MEPTVCVRTRVCAHVPTLECMRSERVKCVCEVCVPMCACTHRCVCPCVRVHLHVRVHVCYTCVSLCAMSHTCIHVHTCTLCVSVGTCVCVRVCSHSPAFVVHVLW